MKDLQNFYVTHEAGEPSETVEVITAESKGEAKLILLCEGRYNGQKIESAPEIANRLGISTEEVSE
jgi:hypothetical protein